MSYLSGQPFGQPQSPFAPQSFAFPYGPTWNAGASHPFQQIQQFLQIVPQQIQQLQLMQQAQIQHLQQLLQIVPAQLHQLQQLVQAASPGLQQPLSALGPVAQSPLGLGFFPPTFGSQLPTHVM